MPRKKQYVARRSYQGDKHKWSQYQMVWLEEDLAKPFIAQHFLVPFNTAINDGLWPPPTKVERIIKALTQKPEPETETAAATPPAPPLTPKPTSKHLIGNRLREAIQKKKAATQTAAVAGTTTAPSTTPTTKLTADKLAAIKAGTSK